MQIRKSLKGDDYLKWYRPLTVRGLEEENKVFLEFCQEYKKEQEEEQGQEQVQEQEQEQGQEAE